MPATAGRVRMPANNRIHSSAALQTHGIWQSAIGYDPYAPHQPKVPSDLDATHNLSSAATYKQNPYDDYQALVAKARLNIRNADEARGSCKKCGTVGHLTYQCRNFLVLKDDSAAAAVEHPVRGGDELESAGHRIDGRTSSEVESEISDSDEDSEMERALAKQRSKRNKLEYAQHESKKLNSSVKKSKSKPGKLKDDTSSTDSSDDERRHHRKHGNSKKKSKSGTRQHGSKRKRPTSTHDSLSSDEGFDRPSRILHKKKKKLWGSNKLQISSANHR